MLADRTQVLIKTINEFESQRERKEEIEKYEKLKSKLEEERARIDNLIKCGYILGNNTDIVNLDSICNELEKIKNSINNNRIEGRECSFLSSKIGDLNRKLNLKWKRYYDEKTVGINKTLRNIKPFFNDLDEINILMDNLEKFEKIWPINRKRYEDFENTISFAKEKINKLNLTDEIKNFINKITANNATLEDLTPNVMEWIKDNSYEDKIKLRFS